MPIFRYLLGAYDSNQTKGTEMDENDITVDADTQAAVEQTQPAADESVDTPVDTASTEPSETSEASDTDTAAAPDIDDKLQQFAKSQGLELDSPGAIKAAAAAMKFRSDATRNHQKANELEKATNITNDQVPVDAAPEVHENVRIRNLEMKLDIQSWKSQNQDKLALEGGMVEILKNDPIKRQMVQGGYLSLDDVYKLAKADAPDGSAAVISQTKKDTLKSLASKQQAAVPAGHATTAASSKDKPFAELSIAEMEKKLGVVRR